MAAITASHIESDNGLLPAAARPDDRLVTIDRLLNQAASDILRELPAKIRPDHSQQHQAAQLRTTLLHVGYVLTHATANTVTRQATHPVGEQPELGRPVELLAIRIRGVEQTLDAHLHQPSSIRQALLREVGSLDRAVDRFLYAAYQSQQPAIDAASGVVLPISDGASPATRPGWRSESAEHGRAPVTDVREGLLPALQASVREWEASRHDMVSHARPDRSSVARDRHGRHPAAAGTARPYARDSVQRVTTSMTRMLTAVTELAVLNQRALADPDRTAPAGVVAALTAEALAERPNMEDPTADLAQHRTCRRTCTDPAARHRPRPPHGSGPGHPRRVRARPICRARSHRPSRPQSAAPTSRRRYSRTETPTSTKRHSQTRTVPAPTNRLTIANPNGFVSRNRHLRACEDKEEIQQPTIKEGIMTTQLPVVSRPHATGIPDGCVSLADIEYLLDTGRIDHVTLAGVPMVSLDGIRDYVRRHSVADYFGRTIVDSGSGCNPRGGRAVTTETWTRKVDSK